MKSMPVFKKMGPGHLISPLPIAPDTRPAQVESFLTSNKPDLVEELQESLRQKILLDSHRLRGNYHDLNFENYDVVSIWKREGEVVGFATCWSRDFFPKGSVRLLNRIYQFPDNCRTFFTREVLRPTVMNCVLQQYALVSELGFDVAFISRELRSKQFFRKFIEKLSLNSPTPWAYQMGPFQVAPGNDFSCFQSIGATHLRGGDLDIFFNNWSRQ